MYDDWWVTPTDILPSLIGFTLGGYAILLAFGDHRFLDLMRQSGSDSEPSAYMDINAVFLHFLLLQFIALILALLAGESSLGVVISSALLERSSTGQLIFTFLEDVYGFISYLFFSYSLLAGLAAALAIFEVGSAYDKAH